MNATLTLQRMSSMLWPCANRTLLWTTNLMNQSTTTTTTSSMTPNFTLNTIQPDHHKKILHLGWKQLEKKMEYSYLWLRDSCQCSQCYHPTAQSRSQLLRLLDRHSQPIQCSADDANQIVHVVWNDGHQSVYPYKFLQLRSFDKNQELWRQKLEKVFNKQEWNREELQDNIPRLEYEEVMKDDQILLKLIEALTTKGLCILNGIPKCGKETERFTRRVSYPQINNYGNFFEVTTKENPSNLAYTTGELGIHADLVFYHSQPGIQGLHCIQRDDGIEGGENLFSDGFYAAHELKCRSPKHFDILTTQDVQFRDYGSDFLPSYHFIQRHKLIKLNSSGEIKRVTFNNQMRDTILPIIDNVEKIQEFYEAMLHLNDILYEQAITYTLLAGELVLFDNQRVLHGRNAYRITKPQTNRHLKGFYFCWDDVLARARRLIEE